MDEITLNSPQLDNDAPAYIVDGIRYDRFHRPIFYNAIGGRINFDSNGNRVTRFYAS